MAQSLPETYKAAVLEAKGGMLVLKALRLDKPGPGQVLVKVLACGVCGTDCAEQQGFLSNNFPIVMGHEFVGDVVAVGPDTSRVKIGDRVGGPWHGGEQK
jgi:D-arabinose 1-dehydrogenase-like Zn-dependent alcohol dehydrogenase